MPLQGTIAWIETLDAKLKFLEITETFEACGNLICCSCEADWQKLYVSNNFKSRSILCDVYRKHVLTIIHVHTFHGSKGDFFATCAVTSFNLRNHYIVANLNVAVH